MKSEYDANVALSSTHWPASMPAVKFKKPNYFFLIALHILIMSLPIFVMLIKGVI